MERALSARNWILCRYSLLYLIYNGFAVYEKNKNRISKIVLFILGVSPNSYQCVANPDELVKKKQN